MSISIVIPVYNMGLYLGKCLDTVVAQTVLPNEVIIVNDGSTDNSISIINDFRKKYNYIKVIEQSNHGLSIARNNGIKEVTSDYIIFLDSDDYLELNAIEKLTEELTKESVDILSFRMQEVYDKNINIITKEIFNTVSGYQALSNFIIGKGYFDTAAGYAFKTTFWNRNKLMFAEHRLHEDFGLIPYVISIADTVKSIDFVGYNYLQTAFSITRDHSLEKSIKKVDDYFVHFYYLKEMLNRNFGASDYDKKMWMSFLANSILNKVATLNKKSRKPYVERIKKEKIADMLLTDTFNRKIKKFLVKYSLDSYLNSLGK